MKQYIISLLFLLIFLLFFNIFYRKEQFQNSIMVKPKEIKEKLEPQKTGYYQDTPIVSDPDALDECVLRVGQSVIVDTGDGEYRNGESGTLEEISATGLSIKVAFSEKSEKVAFSEKSEWFKKSDLKCPPATTPAPTTDALGACELKKGDRVMYTGDTYPGLDGKFGTIESLGRRLDQIIMLVKFDDWAWGNKWVNRSDLTCLPATTPAPTIDALGACELKKGVRVIVATNYGVPKYAGKSGTIIEVMIMNGWEPTRYRVKFSDSSESWVYETDLICPPATTVSKLGPTWGNNDFSKYYYTPDRKKLFRNFMTKEQQNFEDTNFEYIKDNYCDDFGSSLDDSIDIEQMTAAPAPRPAKEQDEQTSRVETCARVCYNDNNCVALTYSRTDNITRCFMYKLKEGKTTFQFNNKESDPGYDLTQEQIKEGYYNKCFKKIKFKKITTTTTTTTQKPFTAPDIVNFRTVGLGKCIPFKYEYNNNKEQNNLSIYNSGLGAGSKKTHLLNKISGVSDHIACGTKCYENIECHAFNYGTSGCVLYKNIDYLSDKTIYSDRNQFEDNKGTSNNTACYIKNVLNPPTTIKPSCNLSYIDFIGSDKKVCNETKQKIKTNNSVKITKDTKYDSYLIV